MKRSESQPLKSVLQEYVNALKKNPRIKELSLLTAWERVVGKTINRSTREIYIKDRKLFVYLNSSVIRNELHHIKDPLVEKLNEEAGSKVIDDIVLK